MVDNTIALGVKAPQINALGAFQEGQQAAAANNMNQMKQAAAAMEMIGAGAMYALGGKIDGEVDPAKYAEVLDSFQNMGIDVSRFRENPNFAKIAAQASVSALDRLKLARSDRDYELALAKFELDVAQAAQPKAPDISTIYGDKSGREQKVIWDSAKGEFVPIGGEKAPSGTSLTVGSDGTIQFEQGTGVGLGKTATNQVQERAINTSELGSRLATIAGDFKPEYQTLGGRFQNLRSAGKAKLDPSLLSQEERKGLEDFATYRSRAMENLNSILKEMSGAAVTPQEFERIKSAMPNAGTGLFDGDDPVSFEAKLKRAMEDADRALARYQFYQVAGIPGSLDDVPLADVQKINGEWYVKKAGKVFKVGAPE